MSDLFRDFHNRLHLITSLLVCGICLIAIPVTHAENVSYHALLQSASDTPSPSATASFTPTPSPTLTPLPNVELHLFSTRDSLTLYVPQSVSLTGFQFVVIENGSTSLRLLSDSFSALALTNGLTNVDDCYVYQADGTNPPLSQSCKGQVFRTNVIASDIFWYDLVTNLPRDIAIYRADQSTGHICSASTPNCTIDWTPLPATPTPTPTETPVETSTPTPTASDTPTLTPTVTNTPTPRPAEWAVGTSLCVNVNEAWMRGLPDSNDLNITAKLPFKKQVFVRKDANSNYVSRDATQYWWHVRTYVGANEGWIEEGSLTPCAAPTAVPTIKPPKVPPTGVPITGQPNPPTVPPNPPTATTVSSGDLTIAIQSWNVSEDATQITLNLLVSNVGAGSMPDTIAVCSYSGTKYNTMVAAGMASQSFSPVSVPSLAPGNSVAVSGTLRFNGFSIGDDPGGGSVSCAVDRNNSISEQSENNNRTGQGF